MEENLGQRGARHRWLGAAFAALTCLILIGQPAAAHEIRPAIVDLATSDEGALTLDIRTNLEALLAGVGSQHRDSSDSPNANEYNRLRDLPAEALTAEFERFRQQFLDGITLTADDAKVPLHVTGVRIPDVGDVALARDSRVSLGGALPDGTTRIGWRYARAFGDSVLRVHDADADANTKTNTDTGAPSPRYSAYIPAGESSDPVPVETIEAQGFGSVFINYIRVGFEHIVPKGLDHILFVVGLFLLSTRLSPLLTQITGFTVAHSISLALGMLGIIRVSPAIVEPLIAASIVYVAVENIFTDRLHRWRPVVVFCFGLLHGLGFAGVLTDIGLSRAHFATGLVAFNIGVEFGQLTVIAVCFAVVGWPFGKRRWYHQAIVIPASAAIAIVAAFWFAQRVGMLA